MAAYEIIKANYEVAKATFQAAEPIVKSTDTLINRLVAHPEVMIGPTVIAGILLGIGIVEYFTHESCKTWHNDDD